MTTPPTQSLPNYLRIALQSGLASSLTSLGARVHLGATGFLMSKVTAGLMLTSAIAGGAGLGVGFSKFLRNRVSMRISYE